MKPYVNATQHSYGTPLSHTASHLPTPHSNLDTPHPYNFGYSPLIYATPLQLSSPHLITLFTPYLINECTQNLINSYTPHLIYWHSYSATHLINLASKYPLNLLSTPHPIWLCRTPTLFTPHSHQCSYEIPLIFVYLEAMQHRFIEIQAKLSLQIRVDKDDNIIIPLLTYMTYIFTR